MPKIKRLHDGTIRILSRQFHVYLIQPRTYKDFWEEARKWDNLWLQWEDDAKKYEKSDYEKGYTYWDPDKLGEELLNIIEFISPMGRLKTCRQSYPTSTTTSLHPRWVG